MGGERWPGTASEKKRVSLYAGRSAAVANRHSGGGFEAQLDHVVESTAKGSVSDVSAVIVAVGVRTGVGVTVAEMTTVLVTPGVAVMTTVMVMVSEVGVTVGVGV